MIENINFLWRSLVKQGFLTVSKKTRNHQKTFIVLWAISH